MKNFEVPEPIINNPYDEPKYYWEITDGEPPKKENGRRPASYYYRPPNAEVGLFASDELGTRIELKLVNRIRERLAQWRKQGYPGVTRTTLELLQYWQRDGREHRLFYAQREAAETIIFLQEARTDFLQGVEIPSDEPGDDAQTAGYKGFRRYACKMATGSGKTTVMAMIAAWSILNKVNIRSDSRFSDVILVVCPNVTIRNRLQELDPKIGEASLYRTRDIVPAEIMPDLSKGRVIITNWHVFEPQVSQMNGISAKVLRTGTRIRSKETVIIGQKTTVARGKRYLTIDEYERQRLCGQIEVIEEEKDEQGNIIKAIIEVFRYVKSDISIVNDVLGRDIGGKQNVLVFNDEAHHAYRIKRNGSVIDDSDNEEEEFEEEDQKEATVWIDGLDKIQKLRGINFCVDLSATPYFLNRVSPEPNRPFPWVVSDFGLTDAIESGLVKIPQLAVRDTTGKEIPGYFNIWRWIIPQLTPAEKGGKKESPKPEAILKYSNPPIAMLAGLWEELRLDWEKTREDKKSPVFIIVCKNIKIAKVMYEWLGENKPPHGIPPIGIKGFVNTNDQINTIRVDTKVIYESESDNSRSDDVEWMRLTLGTVGRTSWPEDKLGRPLYPEGFVELADKLKRPHHPPGRDVRCIVSVGMLTEGWDCNTVTHIVGLRPFMSQLLCEQVVGRGLRRSNYKDVRQNGLLTEEVAKVFGVPFEIIPFKENKGGQKPPPEKRYRVHAISEKSKYEIHFPRVEGYQQAIKNRVRLREGIASLNLDPLKIPPEVEMKAALPSNQGRYSLLGPGKIENVTMNPYRAGRRFQELVFELAGNLTREYIAQPSCQASAHILFPQILEIVKKYLSENVHPIEPANILDVFLSPYYGWVIERLSNSIEPDIDFGETPEVPRYEINRGCGSTADVDFWTSRDTREIIHSHLNYAVLDTKVWEQSAALQIDKHPRVESFVKNAGLGFAIPYTHNGQPHEYVPDFIVRLKSEKEVYLIIETKGYDELSEIKASAARRWVKAVNADGKYGIWNYSLAKKPEEVTDILNTFVISD
ncbi:MAG: DEAD/DEAH box helicase family protein [Bacteroidota bacterium]